MSINDCIEMTTFFCLKCFLFMQKIQGFRDICVLAFYAEIVDGHPKWHINHFWGKNCQMTADTMGVNDFTEIALSHVFLR